MPTKKKVTTRRAKRPTAVRKPKLKVTRAKAATKSTASRRVKRVAQKAASTTKNEVAKIPSALKALVVAARALEKKLAKKL